MLDGLANEQLALSVCESVLEHCAQLPTTIFTLHYMLTRLAHHIHKAKTQEYCNRLLGAKVCPGACLFQPRRSISVIRRLASVCLGCVADDL